MSTTGVNPHLLPLRLLGPPRATLTLSDTKRQFQPSPQLLLSAHSELFYKAQKRNFCTLSCLSSSSPSSSSTRTRFNPSTRLYVSGLSFRTTEDSLRNAFKDFGELMEANLVMDKIANRPRGFAFIRYATEEESKNAIEGMHGKFLDGRVIFVEVAKSRNELRQEFKQKPR